MGHMEWYPISKRIIVAVSGFMLFAPVAVAAAQNADHRIYFVPGAHYGSTARTTFSIAAFRDGRSGIVGRGHLLILEGGRDAVKAQVGIADVSRSVGYSIHLSGLRTQKAPLNAVPYSTYAGTEFHLFVTVVNIGVGYYAPVGRIAGRQGMAAMNFGLGF
jgi:hypothetical protein